MHIFAYVVHIHVLSAYLSYFCIYTYFAYSTYFAYDCVLIVLPPDATAEPGLSTPSLPCLFEATVDLRAKPRGMLPRLDRI